MEERGLDDLSWLDKITPEDIEAMTAGERIALMWPITVAGYLKQGIDVRNRPFRSDLVRLVKRLPDGTEQVIFSTHPGEEVSRLPHNGGSSPHVPNSSMCLLNSLVGGRFDSLIKRESDWVFSFGPGVSMVVECLWRLLENSRIRRTSADHGHQFGLPTPVDCVRVVNACLKDAIVASVELCEGRLDVRIQFDSGHTVEVIPDSAGYEAWQFYDEVREVTAMGGGELDVRSRS